MPRKKNGESERRLLLDILSEIDSDCLPDELRERVSEFVGVAGGCAFCNKPAEFLCDYEIGFPFEMHEGHPVIVGEIFTCDAPLCRSCAKTTGHTFFCGSDAEIESKEVCPFHCEMHETPMRPIEPTHAESHRNKAWKMAVKMRLQRHLSIAYVGNNQE